MNCIVTGGAGFIGSHLIDLLLLNGHDITILDNLSTGHLQNISHFKNSVNYINCDLSKPGDWEKFFINADWVFHLAALADIVPSIEKPDDYFNSNVTATLRVLEASLNGGIKRFIYSASSSCYGIPSVYPTPESSPIKPQYPYALTKRLGEELVLHWGLVYGLKVNSLRFFNVYGPRSRTSGTYGAVFGVFLAQKLASKPYTIVGDGTQTRDFTYVSDVADSLLAVAKSPVEGQIYNVGSGKAVSINRIVELLGGDFVFIPERPGEPLITHADISKIKNDIGWSPKICIEEGIHKIIEKIDYWNDAPVWTPSSIEIATEKWFAYLSKHKN
jgi:UDP-glucose 4-epimerase